MTDERPTEETAKLTHEIWDLRDELRRVESQVIDDARYLSVLLENEEALSDEWKARVRARLEYMGKGWPELLRPRDG